MTPPDNGILSPFPMHTDRVEPLAVLVANQGDLHALCDHLGLADRNGASFFMSRLYADPAGPGRRPFCLTGPVLGAAYAALLAETLIASGAATLIFWGWAGAIADSLFTGDVLVPSAALADDGVTAAYLEDSAAGISDVPTVSPASEATTVVTTALEQEGIPFSSAPVWTTGAIFRETPARVKRFREMGAQAVEMETSALFAVARFRNVNAAALLAVSDELFSGTWKPGFFEPRFLETRKQLCNAMARLCTTP
ncbi:nucleoside phosphorylase [Desulfosudis oleivorans]|uniref:nucleoside phosphorylase n=1 Tax=Desulfosudis oleivorans TaxID=181663 RepID=UPI0006895FC2|nr:nucleoside phosphorylase [Desulfosudis oleivorans]